MEPHPPALVFATLAIGGSADATRSSFTTGGRMISVIGLFGTLGGFGGEEWVGVTRLPSNNDLQRTSGGIFSRSALAQRSPLKPYRYEPQHFRNLIHPGKEQRLA